MTDPEREARLRFCCFGSEKEPGDDTRPTAAAGVLVVWPTAAVGVLVLKEKLGGSTAAGTWTTAATAVRRET